MSSMSSKKSKTSSSSSSSSSFPLSSLPDELALSCLARVSKSDHAALSRVSKTFRSLVTSPDLYKTRSLLRCTENCLYVCLLTPPDTTPRWFILLRRGGSNNPNRFLSPIPPDNCQAPEGSSVVTLDSRIYVIGGLIKGNPTSDVLLLNCQNNTWRWRQVTSMRAARSSATACVVKGKIYVFGGCQNRNSSNWGEIFDPKTQTWDPLLKIPDRKTWHQYFHDSVVVRDEKIYAVDGINRTFYYSPSDGKWGKGNHFKELGNRRDWCLIDKFLYCCDRNEILSWCELEKLECEQKEDETYWKKVKGLDTLEKSLSDSRLVHCDGNLEFLWETQRIQNGAQGKLIDLLPGARLIKSGPNIVLFWDFVIEEEEGDCSRRLEIWCAEISLERRYQGAEIWGNIEWSNVVMNVDPFVHHYKVLHSVSVNL